MPVKNHQRTPADTVRMRGRTNTMTTNVSTASVSTSKRVVGKVRPNSNVTRTSVSEDTSIIVSNHSQFSHPRRPVKLITEVDDTNIDEVLNLADLSLVPISFLAEIQHDQVYETILEELRKKIPHRIPPKATVLQEVEEEEERKPFSPHLFTMDHEHFNDDDLSIPDETSSSSSTTSEHTNIPIHEDYDTDIEPEHIGKDKHDATGREHYREMCEKKKMVPCSYFLAHIQDEKLILRYHQFNTEDIQAITKTLSTNFRVESLLLDGNFLQQQAAKHISQLLIKNDSITELSLADNRLGGGEGTKDICKMISANQHLRKINLSGNKFNELDVTQLVEAFDQNAVLRELDLSHNCFGEECGKVLGAFIATNDTLDSIDLSWNNFRGRSAIDMINGIKANPRLKRCYLERNGFGPACGQILADCIKQNIYLEELNINANRLNTSNAFAIAQALLANESLEVLKMAENQINCDGVLAVFLCVKANGGNRLREIDFAYTVVTQETVNVAEDIVKLKDGKFQYRVGKATPEKLQPNSTSECYIKTNEELLNKLRAAAAKVTPNVPEAN